MPSYSKPLGDAVRQARASLGLTQAQVADLAGVDPRTVLNIENYKGNPKLAVLFPLVRVLRIDPNEIFHPESASDRPHSQRLRVMTDDCSEEEAEALIPILNEMIKALRNRERQDI